MKDYQYKARRRASFGSFLREQRGQALPIMTFMMLSLMGVGALSIDFGRAFVNYRELQSSTDAAALAGAQQLPNSTATTVAANYSAASGDSNAYNWMKNVSVTATTYCSTTAESWGLPCVGSSGVNVLKVTESFSVPTYFARLFGINSIPISTTATAAMNGSAPWNIVIIVDTTESMTTIDSSSECSSQTRLACSLQGVQAFLLDSNLYPCSATAGCGGSDTQTAATAIPASGNYPNPLNRVALYTFPVVETNGTNPIDDDFNCSGTNPSIPPVDSSSQSYGGYQYPLTSDTTYAPPASGILINPTPSPTTTKGAYNATYQVVGFSTDYKTTNGATALNPSSYLVEAIGGKSGCTAMGAPGGLGTYYAGAIYAAQAALVAEQKAHPGSLNAIVLVSDGDATASCEEMGATSTSCPTPAPSGATSNGSYPSWVDECGQAITAAKAAATAGTRVYTVAYGAESTGCTTDTSGTYSGIAPCQTLKDMASSSAYFYSDYDQSGSGIDTSCVGTGSLDTSLSAIFQEIASSLSNARLIPNGTS
ncbi:MAG: pilus assembly protein TadG-related protein [Terracidiphilus sp.]